MDKCCGLCRFFFGRDERCHYNPPTEGRNGVRPRVNSNGVACHHFEVRGDSADLSDAQKAQVLDLIRKSFLEGFFNGYAVGCEHGSRDKSLTDARVRSLGEAEWQVSKICLSLQKAQGKDNG